MNKSQSNKKKIIIISVAKNWGGGEQFILDLCKNITSYEFIIFSPKGTASKFFRESGLSVKEISSLKKVEKVEGNWNFVTIIQIIFNIFVNSFLLLINFILYNPALIVSNGNMAGLYTLIPGLFAQKKLIVTQHLIYRKPSFEVMVLKILIKFSSGFVCVSNAVAENIIKYLGGRNWISRLQVIYNGISLSDPFSQYIKATNEKIHLGYVGSLKKEKGIEMVLEALTLISPALNFLLVVFSDISTMEGRRYYEQTKELIEANNLQSKVLFNDFTTDKNKLYKEIDILINYSEVAEAFSYVIVEALSKGKIVIASNEGGPKEIISDGFNGFLVEPRNPQLLAKVISNCIINFESSSFESIRINAVNTIKDKFNIEKFKQSYEKLFNSLIN